MKDSQKVAEYNRQYYLLHKETILPKARKQAKEWSKNNKPRRHALDKKRRLQGDHPNKSAVQRFRIKRKTECIEAYGGKCQCCGEGHLEMLTIDHKHDNGSEHRKTFKQGGGAIHNLLKKQNYPKDYQCLCFNCNYSKYIGGGQCAHEKEKVKLILEP